MPGFFFGEVVTRNVARALLFTAVLALAVSGQIAAKAGAIRAGAGNIVNPLLALSLLCLFTRAILWSALLRRERLVFAYPVMSLTYPLMLLLAFLVFDEPITAAKISGSVLVIAGVVVLAVSEARL